DDEYEYVQFWDLLDYIGIQAYFPLTKEAKPTLASIKKGWEQAIQKLETLSKKHDKPILFTEVGYKSEATATITPWKWDNFFSLLFKKKSDQTQQLAYEALFQTLWDKPWFSGVYVWQWNTNSSAENASKSLDFSPRFKPAENTIAKWFGKAASSK
ncbi:MAG: hypothetical protein JKY48_06245, partial [Flavobacteriales bacterium]|nr:hypothetical protein [Flavobacteriales bacterium]